MTNKVLFVHISGTNVAGQEIALLNTVKGLTNLGLKCQVVVPSEGRFTRMLKDHKIDTFVLSLNNLHKKNIFPYLKTVFSVFNLIKKQNITIIHCSGASPTQYCLPAAKLAGIPCICHIHTTTYLKEEIIKLFVRKADYVIAVADAVKRQMIEYGCSDMKVRTVYCGVIDESEKDVYINSKEIRDQYKIPNDYKIVGQVSQIIPRKGLEYFIDMAGHVIKLHPKTKFMIIGNPLPGYELYESGLKDMVIKRGLSNSIIFTGFRPDVKKYINVLDISILASLEEALGLVIVESLALGKVVVATSVGGTPEVIVNGKTGILVPPADSVSLSNAVIKILNNPSEAKTIAENGKAFVLEKFSIGTHAKSIFNIYNLLVN